MSAAVKIPVVPAFRLFRREEPVVWTVVAQEADPCTKHRREYCVEYATQRDAERASKLINDGDKLGGKKARVEPVHAGDLTANRACSVCDTRPRASAYTDCDECHYRTVEAEHDCNLRYDGWCSICRSFQGGQS
jgi:hypothetical protein